MAHTKNQERESKEYKNWFYESVWRESAASPSRSFNENKLWIIFEDQNELVQSIKNALAKSRQRCVVIKHGQTFREITNDIFEVNPNIPKDFVNALSAIPNLSELTGVIYSWGSAGLISPPTLEAIAQHLKTTCGGLVNIANTLASSYLSSPPKLWVVNTSIVSDSDERSLVLTSLNALCNVIREEYPELECTHIALDPRSSAAESVNNLEDELRARTLEPDISWRNTKRHVARLVPIELLTQPIPRFAEKAQYMVVGGLRPLGLKLARWYVGHGAKNIVLLDEGEISSKAASDIERLKTQGANIHVLMVNYDNADELASIFTRLKTDKTPLKGLIHAAGIIDQDLLLHMDWDRFASVHRLKVFLSWNLHNLTQDMSLEHFVLFSTCLNKVAPHGKASIATGNSFLNALSYYRMKKKLPALTIEWAPWEIREMNIQHLIDTRLGSRVNTLEIDKGLQIFDSLLHLKNPEIMVADVKWESLLRDMRLENPFYDEIVKTLGLKKDEFYRKRKLGNDFTRTSETELL
jgi:hypothetical protein